MVIEPSRWQDWLDPGHTDIADLGRLLVPAMSGGLTSHPVSTAVNFVRNNGPELIEPLPAGGPPVPDADGSAASADKERPPGELF